MRRKVVQFWAVGWVEPVFRDFFRENGNFFRGAKCGENGALLLAKNGEKWHFFGGAKCGENGALLLAKKWRKMALSKRNLSEKK
jgi:hypothetical protein